MKSAIFYFRLLSWQPEGAEMPQQETNHVSSVLAVVNSLSLIKYKIQTGTKKRVSDRSENLSQNYLTLSLKTVSWIPFSVLPCRVWIYHWFFFNLNLLYILLFQLFLQQWRKSYLGAAINNYANFFNIYLYNFLYKVLYCFATYNNDNKW